MTSFPEAPELSTLKPEDAAKQWVDWWEETYLSLHNDMIMKSEAAFLQQFINLRDQVSKNAKP